MNRPLHQKHTHRGSDSEELAERIAQRLPTDGKLEVQPGLFYNRVSSTGDCVYVVPEPSFCVIAQGSKDVLLGQDRFRYDAAHYLITSMEVPLAGEVISATLERPYLSVRLVLDPSVVTSVLVESGHMSSKGEESTRAVDVSPLDDNLLDATLRLTRLVDTPTDYRMLAPLVVREIVYRLVAGREGNRMRHLAAFGGKTHRITRAVGMIRSNFNKPLRIEDLAREIHMSVSGFHAEFKAVTGMSPLQFQKKLRLQEARRLMLSENLDAAEAGFRVGYDDASHFSRQYKGHFGKPPQRDAAGLREVAART